MIACDHCRLRREDRNANQIQHAAQQLGGAIDQIISNALNDSDIDEPNLTPRTARLTQLDSERLLFECTER